jgi:hypothetical protein
MKTWQTLRKASEWLCRHPALIVVAFVAAYGVRLNDQTEFRTLSAAPFTMQLASQYQFLYSSPLNYFIASYYQHHGVDYVTAYYVVHGLGVLLLLVSVYVALSNAYPDAERATAAIVLLSSPLLLVVLAWIGKTDTFLLACFFFLTATRSRPTELVLATMMTLCHRELGIAVLASYFWLTKRPWLAAAAGALLGEAALYVYTHALLSAVPASRTAFAVEHAASLWALVRQHPFIHLWAALGPFWFYMMTTRRWLRNGAFVLAGTFVLAAGSYDFTRVFVIISAPLIFEVTREVVAEVTRHGGLRLGPYRVAIATLWPFIFLQIQAAGSNLLWAHRIDIRLIS